MKKIIGLQLLSFLMIGSANAQPKKSNATEDQITKNLEIAFEYIDNDSDSARIFIQKAKDLSKKINQPLFEVKILETDEEKIALLKQQMQAYEAEYIKQFNTLDKKYLNALLKEIIAFEIEVSDLQAKEKLSQNKSKADRLSVKQHLQQSDDTIQQNLGKYMLD